MTEKGPSGKPPGTESEDPEPASVVEQDADASTPGASADTPDPFDELWDPDMDTRPEYIRRPRARTRPEARTRGGARGKRRDVV